jgi:hypothetical protein
VRITIRDTVSHLCAKSRLTYSPGGTSPRFTRRLSSMTASASRASTSARSRSWALSSPWFLLAAGSPELARASPSPSPQPTVVGRYPHRCAAEMQVIGPSVPVHSFPLNLRALDDLVTAVAPFPCSVAGKRGGRLLAAPAAMSLRAFADAGTHSRR